MKVFISWSGSLSEQVALELKPWLPRVIQRLNPYVSSEDIYVGERWLTDISLELEEASCGILCLTRENISAPWLNFEAGALSKSLDKARIIPFMFDVKPSDLPANSPLNQFQATRQYNKDEVLRLVKSLNDASGAEKLGDSLLSQTFERWWPDIKEKLDDLKKQSALHAKKVKPEEKRENEEFVTKKNSEILEELLQLSRRQIKIPSGVPSEIINRYKMLSEQMELTISELEDNFRIHGRVYRNEKRHKSLFETHVYESEDSVMLVKRLGLLKKEMDQLIIK